MPIKDPQKRRENHAKYMREVWYPKNKKKHKALVRKRSKELLQYVQDIKRKSSCADCGITNNEHPEIFDFDHLDNKKFSIARMSTDGYSKERIDEEIAKCEVVCANCHRIRTKLRLKKR